MARKRKSDLSKWRRFRQKVEAAGVSSVKVGVLSNAAGNQIVPGAKIDMIGLASVQELGSPARPGHPGIPARPWIRGTFDHNSDATKRKLTSLAAAFLKGKISLAKGLNVLGEWGVAEVRKYVTSGPGVPPPNAASTVERKGSDRPLVDTGRMLGAVTYEVVGGGQRGRAGYRK